MKNRNLIKNSGQKFLKQGPPMKPSSNLENKTPSDTYCRVQLVFKTVQSHSSLESPLEYNQDQIPLTNQGSLQLSERSWELRKYYKVSD